jgi:hypothetical protein
MPYKLREGAHVDLDGNLIGFGSPMPAKPARRLRSQLDRSYEVQIEAMTELDVGVWHIQRADGPDLGCSLVRPSAGHGGPG